MDIISQKQKLETQITIFSWIGGISALFALLPLLWAGYQVLGNHSFFKENELGDFIGGTSGTFASFAGLAFVYVGFLGQRLQILQQQEELELNRKELQETREEIKGQKEQLELQNKQFQIQTFESAFFEHMKINKTKFNNSMQEKSDIGKTLFESIHSFQNSVRSQLKAFDLENLEHVEKIKYIKISSERYLFPHDQSIKSIIDLIISILNLIKKNKTIIDTEYYTDLTYYSLSRVERTVLFYAVFNDDYWIESIHASEYKSFLKRFQVSDFIYYDDYKLLID
jgi:hypothetical protein